MFVFYCIVSNSLYCRVCLFILWGSNFHVFCYSFLYMIIYEILYTCCLRDNICSAWFLDIRISTYLLIVFYLQDVMITSSLRIIVILMLGKNFFQRSINDWNSLPLDIMELPNVARFAKRVLYTYSFKTHFSLPSVSYINAPTAHVFNTAES